MTTAAAVQFSDEYKFDVSTASYLKFAKQYGRIITEEDSVWTRISTRARSSYSLTNWLLALSICLFLADVAMRRFQYTPKWSYAGGSRRGKPENQEAPAVQEAVEEQSVPAPANESDTPAKKASKKAGKPKKAKQSEQTLDTSALLKKKDNRNI